MIKAPKRSEQHFLEGKVFRRYFINTAFIKAQLTSSNRFSHLDRYYRKAVAMLHIIYCTIEKEGKLKVYFIIIDNEFFFQLIFASLNKLLEREIVLSLQQS